jgi:hypothetical protein
MIDNDLTVKIKRWLEEDSHDSDSIVEGANLLLRLNRNQSLHQNILRKPEKYESKVIYELKKFLPIRLARMTMGDVKTLDAQITPTVATAIAEEPAGNDTKSDEEMDLPLRNGKRADHDSLPADIQAIWTENAERWKKIKAAYNTCKTLTEPCDRYEYLSAMKELWYAYKAAFETYDNYKVGDGSAMEETTSAADPTQLVKDINNARSYLSKNIDKLIELKAAALAENADADTISRYQALKENIIQRRDILINNGQTLGDDLTKKIAEGCGETPTTKENTEDAKTGTEETKEAKEESQTSTTETKESTENVKTDNGTPAAS